ncbi:sarcalumenin [Pectinophora gossypiella]|uniref:sarcalumenin n=1 Tax=Pectinophora gossypiella TaxID=13191 RepID=UPI00214F30C2|nr:sarcalumenin [Pectinophora gossypiella]XP_049885448.1 sarcalumenin [Pectinophora gossypiella]XP_049885449.1 sarcalumenin [Pectinophora gossypiella]XP_049885450.1 sarcalumenin [Pectinophora gossypiella]
MWTTRLRLWRFMLCILLATSTLALVVRGEEDVPSESQCRPYIEKALKELESGDSEPDSAEKNDSSEVSVNDDTKEVSSAEDGGQTTEAGDSKEDDAPSVEVADEPYVSKASVEDVEGADDDDSKEDATVEDADGDSAEQQADSKQDDDDKEDGDSKEDDDNKDDGDSKEDSQDSKEEGDSKEEASADEQAGEEESGEEKEGESGTTAEDEASTEGDDDSKQDEQADDDGDDDSKEAESAGDDDDKSQEDAADQSKEDDDDDKTDDDDGSQEKAESTEDTEKDDSKEDKDDTKEEEDAADKSGEDKDDTEEAESAEDSADGGVEEQSAEADEASEEKEASKADTDEEKSDETAAEDTEEQADQPETEEDADSGEEASTEEEDEEGAPEEDLLLTGEIPENLRSRDHINQILRLDEEASEAEILIERSADIVLRDLKKLYENSIKPLEALYKYRDLSNRHFGDPEIFSKPLVLFMGPWSGGKSSIVNYLTGLEFTEWSLRTGAEPSPAYFNILMHGKNPEVLDGTQLAADWTFSGLQKFGQGLEERLRGLKHPSKILEKVNIVEIPGILEVRKQVSRVFPFNDACQWFIDRADIIFLVYDPSKLDVGPETEAILDQLKGRESQTRIVLNKADTVKPEELMRVQSALIWNISPLMSSAQPPVMYTVSLWSMPYEPGAPVRLLQAQERELLRDLRQAIDKRIENKIASARRFAVRVRNHAKMVDCYLTTYYNHKTIFGNRKLISDAIIENPQNYHIYEGLSTLTNISRYDLPDPETYRDFFRLNPLYEFQQLSATCTYFRGCPITRLDVAIAYDLPELVGKYKKMVETATPQGMPKS